MFNHFSAHFCRGLTLIWVLACGSCGTTERQAAERLDTTPQIIQEASGFLAADKELKGYPIQVDGFKGAISLTGQVATEAQKKRAAMLVWAVRGVKSVENRLDVGDKPAK
jgi:osmotically-inducible protein OsmY